MTTALKGNAVIGQSGGPTCVINQTLVGAIEAIGRMPQVGKFLGARHGVRGIINERFVALDDVPPDTLEAVANTPAAALGSTRDKADQAYCEKIFRVFEKHNIRYFFYIGGNDSSETAHIVNDLAKQAGYELRTFHIPKTIDNDLLVTDHCPGYGSAARFVASALMGDDRDSASLPGVKIDVIMGRHAGWLTAATALGRRDETCGPHLIYLPERKISEEQMLGDIDDVVARLGRCVVAVSEGIVDETGTAWAETISQNVERDAFGNLQLSGSGALGDHIGNLVKAKLKSRVRNDSENLPLSGATRIRADTFGYLQRSFPGYASAVDQAEARLAGRKAVEFAMSGDTDGSVAFQRTGNGKDYGVSCILANLADVAGGTKTMPDEFLADNGHDITDAFREYALPLVGGLPKIGRLT